ncbi:MAG: hypothetical protein KDA24_19415 [Deltaproteobacteria bacterium]|nr:hypothetical protein [Deltaproteobacteria bacterium]
MFSPRSPHPDWRATMRLTPLILVLLLPGCEISAPDGPAISAPAPVSDRQRPPNPDQPPIVDDEPPGEVIPLYDEDTLLEPDWIVETEDAVITRFADRGRDRHAREDQFQSYDHFLAQYWHHRTARMRFVDYVARGGDTIEVSMVTEWRLTIPEFRAWYLGLNTVATYSGNYAPTLSEEGPGTFDIDHDQIDGSGTQYKYSFVMDSGFDLGANMPLAVGQYMEFEASQFLDGAPGERQNYYGTTGLYAVGVGGVVPWKAVGDFANPGSRREDSEPIDEKGWLGGRTTLPYQYSDEPDNHFMQMPTNLSSLNGQRFVRGRRVHHTNMQDGSHDESAANGTFGELVGLVGPNYVHTSCDGCHRRNGRAEVVGPGEPLDKWVFKVAAGDGEPHPQLGRVLQPNGTTGSGEGGVVISEWVEDDGLRSPVYSFEDEAPELFSARLAPQIVGIGLLESIPEADILDWEDPDDEDGDGISGRAQRVPDPETGELRLGRFGWKAASTSTRHQVAGALNTDMGVMTSVLPEPDCGAEQEGCGDEDGAELSDEHLADLVKYVSLLGVRARRDLDDAEALAGEEVFGAAGCDGCHRASYTTSPYHPLAELRAQTIAPYTDLLLHDLGPAMADNLGEGDASGAEWRTAPLWGLGLGPCVTGGVMGPEQSESCTPSESYLHDGRARTLTEAVLWHGGEGSAAREAFEALTEEDTAALLRFLRSL